MNGIRKHRHGVLICFLCFFCYLKRVGRRIVYPRHHRAGQSDQGSCWAADCQCYGTYGVRNQQGGRLCTRFQHIGMSSSEMERNALARTQTRSARGACPSAGADDSANVRHDKKNDSLLSLFSRKECIIFCSYFNWLNCMLDYSPNRSRVPVL